MTTAMFIPLPNINITTTFSNRNTTFILISYVSSSPGSISTLCTFYNTQYVKKVATEWDRQAHDVSSVFFPAPPEAEPKMREWRTPWCTWLATIILPWISIIVMHKSTHQDDIIYIQCSKFQYNENFVINKNSQISQTSGELYSNTTHTIKQKTCKRFVKNFRRDATYSLYDF